MESYLEALKVSQNLRMPRILLQVSKNTRNGMQRPKTISLEHEKWNAKVHLRKLRPSPIAHFKTL
jgi:hypothetical protein